MTYNYDEIAKAIVTDHTTYANGVQSYEPCYFWQGNADTDEKVMSLFVSGAKDRHGFPLWREKAYDALSEWESDCVWRERYEHDNTACGERIVL